MRYTADGNPRVAALLRQAVRFVGVSGAGWLVDFAVFSLMAWRGLLPAVANMMSSCIGASFTFVFSTRFVFRRGGAVPMAVKWAAYIVWELLLIAVASKLLGCVDKALLRLLPASLAPFCAPAAKCAITPFTMCANFFAMRYAIERL